MTLHIRLPLPAILLLILAATGPALAQSQELPAPDRAAWMREAKWGVMHHWLADWMQVRHCLSPYGFRTLSTGSPSDAVRNLLAIRDIVPPKTPQEWNRLVDGFDEQTLAEQVKQTGAGWFILTVGQNSGHYCSPNATYDRLTKIEPSKCSRRDLVADVAKAMKKRGIRMIVYLPATPPGLDRDALAALGWKHGAHRNAEYQTKWEAIIREWGERWGTLVDGWWFDGCYWPDATYRHDEPPNFESFAAAARAGNPDRVVCFNPGVKIEVQSEHEDYTAGEIADPRRVTCGGANFHGSQWHMLSHLGHTWGWSAQPRFADAEVARITGRLTDAGGAVTWDIPLTDQGHIPNDFCTQLEAIGRAVKMTPKERDAAFPPPGKTAGPPKPPGNLAFGKPAQLLSLDGSRELPPNCDWHVAEYGVDGDRRSYAQASNEWPWTYQVDLGGEHRVDRIVVRFGRNFATQYDVRLSADGKTWHQVAQRDDAVGATQRIEFKPIPCRYVQVRGMKPDGPGRHGYQMSIAELEVYGEKGSGD